MWFTPGGGVALRVTDGVNLRASITSCNETFTGLGFSFRAQGFPCALVKNLPAMREAWVRSLGWEDPLQKGTTAHSCSGLENFMGRRAWQATVYGVTKSRTRLSDLHSLTSGHRNFVNDCKFSNNQQDSLVCSVESLMSRLSYPREGSLYLDHLHLPCARGSRGAAPSSHLASRLPAAFPEVGKAK